MRIHPLLIGIPAAYLLFRGVSKGYGASRLGFQIVKIVPRFSGITPILDFHIAAQNPSGESFTIESMVADVYANETFVGNMTSFVLTEVKPNTQSIFVASLRLSLTGIAAEIFNAVQGGITSISQKLKIVGTVNVSGVPIPVSITYNIL
jgi:LEA14-like dessication related protein